MGLLFEQAPDTPMFKTELDTESPSHDPEGPQPNL